MLAWSSNGIFFRCVLQLWKKADKWGMWLLNIAHLMKKSSERTRPGHLYWLDCDALPQKALEHVLVQELRYPGLFLILKDPYRKVLSDTKSPWGNWNLLFQCWKAWIYQTETPLYAKAAVFCIPYICDLTTRYPGDRTCSVLSHCSAPCFGSVAF